MAIWDWLRELPIVDDVADTLDILAEFLPEGSVSTVPASDYGELRDTMYWTIGNDGVDTRQRLLVDSSLEPVLHDEDGRVARGLWRDPHTGFESRDPSDFDVDHRVPFREIVNQLPQLYELPREEQLEIYNDAENLQVVHDQHNFEKGDATPEQHARTFADPEARREFLRKCADYLGRLNDRIS